MSTKTYETLENKPETRNDDCIKSYLKTKQKKKITKEFVKVKCLVSV
jgi:hypothetical protein